MGCCAGGGAGGIGWPSRMGGGGIRMPGGGGAPGGGGGGGGPAGRLHAAPLAETSSNSATAIVIQDQRTLVRLALMATFPCVIPTTRRPQF
jgi:hypothetical protein